MLDVAVGGLEEVVADVLEREVVGRETARAGKDELDAAAVGERLAAENDPDAAVYGLDLETRCEGWHTP